MTREEAVVICMRLLRQAPLLCIDEQERTGWGRIAHADRPTPDETRKFLHDNWDLFNEGVSIAMNNISGGSINQDGRVYLVTQDHISVSDFVNSYEYGVLLRFMVSRNILYVGTSNNGVIFTYSRYYGRSSIDQYELHYESHDFSTIKPIQWPDGIDESNYEGQWVVWVKHFETIGTFG